MLKRHLVYLRSGFAILLLALLASTGAFAQWSPPAVNLPWNNYIPSRIPDGFSSIIGLSGTTLLPNTSQTYYYSAYAQQVALPFDFYFLGTTYPAGYYM